MTRFLKWAWVPVLILLVVAACTDNGAEKDDQTAASTSPTPSSSPTPSPELTPSPEPTAPVPVDREGPSMYKFEGLTKSMDDLYLEYQPVTEKELLYWPKTKYWAKGNSLGKELGTFFYVVEFEDEEAARTIYNEQIELEKDWNSKKGAYLNGALVLMLIDRDSELTQKTINKFKLMAP